MNRGVRKTVWNVALAICVLGVACAHPAVERPPSPPVDWGSLRMDDQRAPKNAPTARERDTAGSYVTALMSAKLEPLTTLLASDASGSFSGSLVNGRDRVVELHQLLFGAFDSRRVVATRVLVTASSQAIEWRMTGLQSRDWMRVPPTNRTVTFNGITLVWTNDDGTIAGAHVYFDVAAVRGQLGVGPRALVELKPPQPVPGPERLEQTGAGVEMANVAIVQAEIDARAAHDETAYLSSLADDIAIYSPEMDEPMRGKAAARKDYEALDHAVGQMETTVRDAWGIGGFVVVEYSIAGVQVAPIGWVPLVPDRVVGLHVVDVVELNDSRISRIWRYDNLEELAVSQP